MFLIEIFSLKNLFGKALTGQASLIELSSEMTEDHLIGPRPLHISGHPISSYHRDAPTPEIFRYIHSTKS